MTLKLFIVFGCATVSRSLVPQPAIKPASLAVKDRSPNHRTARELPPAVSFKFFFFVIKIQCTLLSVMCQLGWEVAGRMCFAAQSCLTLCDPMDCNPQGSSVHGASPGKNTGVGCHAFLQGSSQPRDRTQVSLPHCRQILYRLSHDVYVWLSPFT